MGNYFRSFMASPIRRGCLAFVILVRVVAFVCVGPAFFWLPGAGQGVALPVIVPAAEVLTTNFLGSGIEVTNTLTSMIVVDILVILVAVVVGRRIRAQAPDRFVPRGLSNVIEFLGQFLYDQAHGLLGKYTRAVFPLAASLFVFLLVANMIKLVPGVESIGIVACAEKDQTGYPLAGTITGSDGQILPQFGMSLVNNALELKGRAGTKATEEDYQACIAKYSWAVPPLPKPPEKETTPAAATHPTTPDLLAIVPFFRGLATDLNVPISLALIVFFMSELWGLRALGLPYLYKFVNLPALGHLNKKPMGAIDFVVGLVEIISELSRLVSLSFRLFGSIFAGSILLIVLSFLTAFLVPLPIYFLEIVIGMMQAYVFAILTIIYAQQAVTSHHEGEHAEAHSQ